MNSIRSVLFLVAFVASTSICNAASEIAQGAVPAPVVLPEEPPAFLSSQEWRVHDGKGQPLPYKIVFTWVGFDPITGEMFYDLDIINIDSGKVVAHGEASDGFGGYVIDVWTSDSGLSYTWEWQGDHYKKVGGTANKRTFYPM
ncbi:MAG: hypothetical protein AB8H80_11010 [Planctomycetota bacterium]